MEEKTNENAFVCTICNKSFKDKRRLNAHSFKCKPKEIQDNPEQDSEQKASRKTKFKSLSNDIKWMYREMGGRTKLLTEAKNDPRFFKMLVEVMLRSEQRVEEARDALKDKEADTGKTMFIIKGLHTSVGGEDKSVDIEIKKLRSSIMPEREDFQEEIFVDEASTDHN